MIKQLYNKEEIRRLLSMSAALTVYMLFLLIALNILEIKAIDNFLDATPSRRMLFFKGLASDIMGVYRLLLIPFALSFIIPNRWWAGRLAARILILLLHLIIATIAITTSFFFTTAFVPLDHSVFSYSWQEILYTIRTSGLNVTTYIFLIVSVLLFISSVIFLKINKIATNITLLLLIILSLLYPSSKIWVKQENNFLITNLIRCKADYLLERSLIYWQKPKPEKIKKNETLLSDYINNRIANGFIKDTAQLQSSLQVSLQDYPLLHTSTYNPLAPYFKPFKHKPNIVFLIIESLDARVFKDFEEQNIVLAPFLSQLKNKSLYWKNFYSIAERTFGVLPAVLGSLPMGDKGFNDVSPIPLHKTLVSILKDNHYQTNFFYGGWVGFQGMEPFLLYQNTDHIYTHYPKTYQYKGKTFDWGIQDHLVFKRSIEVLDSIQKTPFLNIYLTLSTHTPFHLPNRSQLANQLKRLNSHLDTPTWNKINTDKYLSILYLDNSIQQLINDYKATNQFNNTIFIITGDHCMHELGKNNTLQTYGVPLLIYSPLLLHAQTFDRPSSHLDIAPSVVHLLKNKNIIHTDSISHWLGLGLDTATTLRKNTFIPFMNNNKDIISCVFNDYFYTENTLYKIGKNNALTPLQDKDLANTLHQKLQTYNYINEYVTQNNKLMPLLYFIDKDRPTTTENTNNKHNKQTKPI